jgi:hypothetical protein
VREVEQATLPVQGRYEKCNLAVYSVIFWPAMIFGAGRRDNRGRRENERWFMGAKKSRRQVGNRNAVFRHRSESWAGWKEVEIAIEKKLLKS